MNIYKLKEKIKMWIAWRLPREIVRWAYIRVVVNASCGKYSNIEVPKLTAMDALEVWK